MTPTSALARVPSSHVLPERQSPVCGSPLASFPRVLGFPTAHFHYCPRNPESQFKVVLILDIWLMRIVC